MVASDVRRHTEGDVDTAHHYQEVEEARDALEKLVSYSVLAGQNVAIPFIRRTVASVIDLVVFLRRTGRNRLVEEITYVPDQLSGDVFTVESVFVRNGSQLAWSGTRPDDPRLDPAHWLP